MKKVIKKFTQDLLTYLLIFGPFGSALALSWRLCGALSPFELILVMPLVFVFSYILFLFLFRLALPRLKKGVYVVGFNKGFLTWYTHSMLSRSARVFGLHYVLHAFSLTRFLYWRALGMKASFFTDSSYKIVIHDHALIEIEEGCILAEDVELSAHLITGDRLLVAPVKISKNVFIGRTTYIGPRTTIGEGAWVGMGLYLHNKTIPAHAKLESPKS